MAPAKGWRLPSQKLGSRATTSLIVHVPHRWFPGPSDVSELYRCPGAYLAFKKIYLHLRVPET